MKTLTPWTAHVAAALFLAACANAPQDAQEATSTPDGAPATPAMSSTYTVNPEKSTVLWTGIMLGVKEHHGRLNVKEGSLALVDGKVTGGKVVVDMTTIAPTDSAYTAEQTKEKLVKHLGSPDFFDVSTYPMASAVLKPGADGEPMVELHIRDHAAMVPLRNVQINPQEGGLLEASAELTFNRKEFGVSFDMPMKDLVISNDVTLQVMISALAN